MVQQYMKDPQSVDPTLAHAVVAVAARHGDAELYNQFKAQMKTAKSPEAVLPIVPRALAQFPEPKPDQQTLASTLTPAVRGQDLYMLRAHDGESRGARKPRGTSCARTTTLISAKTGGGLGGVGVFLYATERLLQPEKEQEVKQFFKQHPIPGTERNQKEALESINSCVNR